MSTSKKADFYLSSSEGYGLETPRACYRVRSLGGRSADDYLLVRIEPPIIGQPYGLGDKDINLVVLATRHVCTSLFPVSAWPLSVHVARIVTDIDEKQAIEEKDIESIAWAEIYKTEEDAKEKRYK